MQQFTRASTTNAARNASPHTSMTHQPHDPRAQAAQHPAPGLPRGANPALGTVLRAEGIVTLEDIRRGMNSAEGHPSFLKLLLCCPVVSEAELYALLVARYQVPVLNLDAMDVPRAVLDILSPRDAYELECLPVAKVGNLVCVGVPDLGDLERIRKLRALLRGLKVKLFPCERGQLRKHIVKNYVFPGRTIATDQQRRKTTSYEDLASAVRIKPPKGIDQTLPPVAQDRGDTRPIDPLEPEEITTDELPEPDELLDELDESFQGPLPPPQLEGDDATSGSAEREWAAEEYEDDIFAGVTDEPSSDTEDDLSQTEFEKLLGSVSAAHPDQEPIDARPVPHHEWTLALQECWKERVHNWERIHFSHAPLNAEEVVLGLPSWS